MRIPLILALALALDDYLVTLGILALYSRP